VIECSSCNTLNPDAEPSCLVCGAALARPAQTGVSSLGTARCPAGHPIDPSWKSCPYCDRQTASSQPGRSTRLDDAAAPAPPVVLPPTRLEGETQRLERRTRLEGEGSWPEPAPAPAGPKPTRLESAEPSGRRTVLQEGFPTDSPPPVPVRSGPGSPGTAAPPVSGSPLPVRRLLAVLAAPDLGPGGTVFPVRAGRTTIGADPASDVSLGADSEVSREHAAILYRNNMFHLADRLSTNGTWINGQEVPANGTVPLQDRDRVRCGRTEMVFLVIEPAAEAGRTDF
jgi:FHA domain-containing protein